jgi:hypothetical protein
VHGSRMHRSRDERRNENGDPKIAVNSSVTRTFRTEQGLSASRCTDQDGRKKEVHPARFERATFGSVGSLLEPHSSGKNVSQTQGHQLFTLPKAKRLPVSLASVFYE